MSKVKVSALLLCAGKSSRMIPDHKLLLSIAGKTVIKNTAEEIVNARFAEIIAVTGHEHTKIEKELEGLPIKIVYNENFERGLHSSIREGIMHLNPETDFFAVCLGDQPMLGFHHYNQLIEAAQAESEKTSNDIKLIYPDSNGQRGNPVLISSSLILEILEHKDDDKGCAYLFKRYPESSLPVVMEDEASLLDIDTMDLFNEVKNQIESRLEKDYIRE